MRRSLVSLVLCVSLVGSTRAATWIVASAGGDFPTIQAALDAAVAGDVIQVREGPTPYFEKVVFPRSGDAAQGFISLEAYPGERPVLDGTGVSGAHMVLMQDRSWVRLAGFEIRNDLGVNDGSGVRIEGAGSHVESRFTNNTTWHNDTLTCSSQTSGRRAHDSRGTGSSTRASTRTGRRPETMPARSSPIRCSLHPRRATYTSRRAHPRSMPAIPPSYPRWVRPTSTPPLA